MAKEEVEGTEAAASGQAPRPKRAAIKARELVERGGTDQAMAVHKSTDVSNSEHIHESGRQNE